MASLKVSNRKSRGCNLLTARGLLPSELDIKRPALLLECRFGGVYLHKLLVSLGEKHSEVTLVILANGPRFSIDTRLEGYCSISNCNQMSYSTLSHHIESLQTARASLRVRH